MVLQHHAVAVVHDYEQSEQTKQLTYKEGTENTQEAQRSQ
jgi:hypothetical protein